jgi:hypothetical protein
MHNREALTPSLLWQSVKDFDLWPIYILGLTFQTPMSTPANYLTLSLKGLGFDTFRTNLLVIPSKVLHVIAMLALTYAAEVFGELTLVALIGQLWALPFLVFIYLVDLNSINKWMAWGIMTALLMYPSGMSTTSLQIVQAMLIWSLSSTSHTSRLELPKQQHSAFPHRLSSSIQHVGPNIRHHSS